LKDKGQRLPTLSLLEFPPSPALARRLWHRVSLALLCTRSCRCGTFSLRSSSHDLKNWKVEKVETGVECSRFAAMDTNLSEIEAVDTESSFTLQDHRHPASTRFYSLDGASGHLEERQKTASPAGPPEQPRDTGTDLSQPIPFCPQRTPRTTRTHLKILKHTTFSSPGPLLAHNPEPCRTSCVSRQSCCPLPESPFLPRI